MSKKRILKITICLITIISIISTIMLYKNNSIAANLNDWTNEVRSYFSRYGFKVNGKYEERWLLYDVTGKYKDLYCIRSGDRQHNKYTEIDLYNISQEEKNNLFASEANYKQFMWALENMYLYGENKSDKISVYNSLIGASSLPYYNDDIIGNSLYHQIKGKVGQVYNVKRTEQLIKTVQNEALLQLVKQSYARNVDINNVYGNKYVNGNNVGEALTGTPHEYAQKIMNTLLNTSKSANYNVNNKNKNFGTSSYDGNVTITSSDDGSDWNNGISGKFTVNNKYKATITNVNVYLNGNKLTSGYEIVNMNGDYITSSINNALTVAASEQAYEFRVKCDNSSANDNIKVELDVDYGYITKAVLLKPVEDTTNEKKNQYMINVSRERKTSTVSTEQNEQKEEIKIFDLALTKEITRVDFPAGTEYGGANGETFEPKRLKSIDTSDLKNGEKSTARYIMDKSLVSVEANCLVTYKITVYNEGQIDGYAEEITDYLPEGLELATDSTINNTYGWVENADGTVSTNYLSKDKNSDNVLKAFNGSEFDDTSDSVKYVELQCKVNPTEQMKSGLSNNKKIELDNRAEISRYGYISEDGSFVEANTNGVDIDSIENSVLNDSKSENGSGLIDKIKDRLEEAKKDSYFNESYTDKAILAYEDDDDIERLALVKDARKMDLALRKWIIKVDDKDYSESREPSQVESYKAPNPAFQTSILGAGTLDYDNQKDAIQLKPGSTVVYRIAVFNEGTRNAFAEEITDYLPQGLEFVENDETNKANGWVATKNEDGTTTVKTEKFAKKNGKEPTLIFKDYNGNEINDDSVKNTKELIKSQLGNDDYNENVIMFVNKAYSYNSMQALGFEAYKTIDIVCKVSEDINERTYLTNRAEITKYGYYDGQGNFVQADVEDVDLDSEQDTIKDDLNLDTWYFENYDTVNPKDTYPGVQDDDDFETVIVEIPEVEKEFDLSLRKFISSINGEKLDGEESREPGVDSSKLVSGESTTAEYTHTKEAKLVSPQDIVEYTLRIYNEGEIDGYATMVMDDIPEGVEMVAPTYDENGNATNLNAEYRWVMYKKYINTSDNDSNDSTQDAETVNGLPKTETAQEETTMIRYNDTIYVSTTNIEEAELIVTDYLSKENGEAIMAVSGLTGENPNLIKEFDYEKGVFTKDNYRDIKVEFKVKTTNEENKEIINYAQITECSDGDGNPVTDRDSTPNKWIDTDDDQDIEKIKVRYFDLALYKWVSTAMVTEDGKTKEYPSNHTQDDKSDMVDISIPKNKLDKVTVKFKYQIKVENQGQLEGYAKEIKDHIPAGLKFIAEDNIEYGWIYNEEDNTITTDYLKDTLLQPGETAEVTVVLTWINAEDNLGQKVNYAEISEDYNDYGDTPDIDSTPDNFTGKSVEDDEDDDVVMLQVRTGMMGVTTYVVLGVVVMAIISCGAVCIKKFVLI